MNNSKSIILKEIDKSLINKKNNKNSLKASVEANTILKEMISSKRYGNCKLYIILSIRRIITILY